MVVRQRPEITADAPCERAHAAGTLEVALTFDDLPLAPPIPSCEASVRITGQLVTKIMEAGAPAVGFVNEGCLATLGTSAHRRAFLEAWLRSGLELGNHTYSHVDYHTTPFEAFARDVLRGQARTRPLAASFGIALRYFRHPYLRTGRTRAAKGALSHFLSAHGYEIAPVTIDTDDWVFHFAYEAAQRRGDAAQRLVVLRSYVAHVESAFAFAEAYASLLFGRPIRQVALFHASALNAAAFADVAAMIRGRGYAFVSLNRALKDDAYRTPDTYFGMRGVSWLHRWARPRGCPNLRPPRLPDVFRAFARTPVPHETR